jgi:hypothetical protein
VKLARGSWVIQNGADSGVGRATVAIAKPLGLRTVNVVRRDEVVAEIKALGDDVVLVDGPDLAQRVAAETGNGPINLALDGISDTSPMNLMNRLSEGGVRGWQSLRGDPFCAGDQLTAEGIDFGTLLEVPHFRGSLLSPFPVPVAMGDNDPDGEPCAQQWPAFVLFDLDPHRYALHDLGSMADRTRVISFSGDAPCGA